MKALPLFLLCYFLCIGCTNPERDRAALLKQELAETPILALQFDSLMREVRRLPSTYQVDILLDVASRNEGRKSVAKQEALVLEALSLASKKEKKKLLLQLVDYYARFGVFSPMGDVRAKCLLRIEELEEQYSLSQEERWKVKREKAGQLKHLSESERSLSVWFELLAEHRAAGKPELVIEDLVGIAPIFTWLGDHEKVISLQKEAYQLAVEHQLPEYQKKCSRSLVVGLYRFGKYAEIIELYWKTNLDFFAGSEYTAYSMLASCHLQLARPDSARFYLEKMVQGSATASDATFYSRLAETYFSENREDSATATMTKLIDCLRKEAKTTEEMSEAGYPFPFSFLSVCSTYANLLHRNGKDREASKAFDLVVPLMEKSTKEDAVLADQIDALTRYSNFCRALQQYEKVSNLLARRDSLRDIYTCMMDERDSKRVADRFKTKELMYTIEKQQTQLSYSNRVLAIVGVATLVLGDALWGWFSSIVSAAANCCLFRIRSLRLNGYVPKRKRRGDLLFLSSLHRRNYFVRLNERLSRNSFSSTKNYRWNCWLTNWKRIARTSLLPSILIRVATSTNGSTTIAFTIFSNGCILQMAILSDWQRKQDSHQSTRSIVILSGVWE